MQPVQDCLCMAVLFQGFVVTSILDAYHVYFIDLKVYHCEDTRQVSFVDNTTDIPTEVKSLTCINGRFFVGSDDCLWLDPPWFN